MSQALPVRIEKCFSLNSLSGPPETKTALLINPPIYDTQYWAEWAQPYGLLRIGALLKKSGYKRVELFDFLETDSHRKVPRHRIDFEESYSEKNKPSSPIRPYQISKNGESLDLYKYHFGKDWAAFDEWLKNQGFTPENPPDEVWVSAIMTYWWESVRDLTARVKRIFGSKTTIILGGIYPTLVPEHAVAMTSADIIVSGEIEAANDCWTDLSLYTNPPSYAIITPSRGCPFNCDYCAQKTLNGGAQTVRYRQPEDIVAEMQFKYESFGIRDFAFYADFLLWDIENRFSRVMQLIIDRHLPFKLHAPEGLDTKFLSRSPRLLEQMKAANFQKIYLPMESIDDSYLSSLNRKHVQLQDFVRAAKLCEETGFRLRNLEVNAFVLYGLPGEHMENVVKTVILVSEVVGSIIPMLFAPVPSTGVYRRHLPFFQEHGWDTNLHMLNGKLFPFLEINEGSVSDYVDLQRLMFTLNSHYRSRSFQLFGDTQVSNAFRKNLGEEFHSQVSSLLNSIEPSHNRALVEEFE